jgi:hypothetical protein
MRLLEALASIFINVFGITQPTDKKRRQVAWFLLIMLTLIILGLVAVASVLIHVL